MSRKGSQPVPNRLRFYRERAGFTGRRISVLLDIDPLTYWRWERREAAIPDHRKTELAVLFGCTPAELMGWVPEQDPDPERDYESEPAA